MFLADGKPFYEIERSSLGLNEKEARDGGLDIHIGRFPFQCSAKAVAMREPEGFVKLIADKHTGRLLGAHIIGENATELIGECTLAMHLGATVSDLAEVVKGHPSLSETVTEAALEWSAKSIHLPRRGSPS